MGIHTTADDEAECETMNWDCADVKIKRSSPGNTQVLPLANQ